MGTKTSAQVHQDALGAAKEASRADWSVVRKVLKAYFEVWEEADTCSCTGFGCECEVGAALMFLSYF